VSILSLLTQRNCYTLNMLLT